jgi:hypothetical protein
LQKWVIAFSKQQVELFVNRFISDGVEEDKRENNSVPVEMLSRR